MNPVNATALYVSACRALLQCDPAEPETYGGLFNILPFFRDALSCLVCGQLLQDPIAPKNSTCQHHVCKGCKGKKMFLKPSCSWCKDYEDFEENKQLQILIDCYRSLCECVAMWITTEQKAFGVKGYPEVRKMLEEVLVLKEEPEQFEIQLFDDKDNLDVPQIKTEIDSSKYSVDMKLIGSDQASDPEITDPVCVDELLKLTEPCVDNVNGDLANTILDQMTSAESCDDHDHACVKSETVSGDFFKDQPCKRMSILCEQTNTSPQPYLFSESDTSVAPPHTNLPQSQMGASRLSTTHRKARLSRKRSRSESDSEMIQLLPLTSLIQGSSQSSTPTPKTAQEVKSSPPVVVSNTGVLKVNKDSSKNIQIHAELGSRKVPVKSKVSVSKSKAKAKERVLSANLIQGQPPKAVYKKTQEKKGCKCGRATQNPSVLTCRGQRCPCYSNRKACLDCICRGCQNSYMANGEKKLEAFAVPEKALEQTRLTLGINLTSISVRNAGSSPGVLSLSAGSPMASFLTSGADEDQTFEDALDMHFDC